MTAEYDSENVRYHEELTELRRTVLAWDEQKIYPAKTLLNLRNVFHHDSKVAVPTNLSKSAKLSAKVALLVNGLEVK